MCDLGCIASCNGLNPFCAFSGGYYLLSFSKRYCMYCTYGSVPWKRGLDQPREIFRTTPHCMNRGNYSVPRDLPRSTKIFISQVFASHAVSITHAIYPRGKKNSDDIRQGRVDGDRSPWEHPCRQMQFLTPFSCRRKFDRAGHKKSKPQNVLRSISVY